MRKKVLRDQNCHRMRHTGLKYWKVSRNIYPSRLSIVADAMAATAAAPGWSPRDIAERLWWRRRARISRARSSSWELESATASTGNVVEEKEAIADSCQNGRFSAS